MMNHVTIEGRTIDSTFVFERTAGDDVAYQMAILAYFRDEEKIPLSKLAKYYLNENLNFLCGSGTSVAIGGKTINKDENRFAEILVELKALETPEEYIAQLIKFLESDDLPPTERILSCGAYRLKLNFLY